MKNIRKYFAAAILPLMTALPAVADDSFCLPDTVEHAAPSFNEAAQFIFDISTMIGDKVELDAYSIGPDAGKAPNEVTTGHTLARLKVGADEAFLMFNNETGTACEVTPETFNYHRPANAPFWGMK